MKVRENGAAARGNERQAKLSQPSPPALGVRDAKQKPPTIVGLMGLSRLLGYSSLKCLEKLAR